MKRSLIVLIALFFAKTALAQKELLSFDENNKYICYQVADMPGLPKDTLLARAFAFLKSDYPKIKIDRPNQNGLTVGGKFLIYGGVSVLKHEHGQMAYALTIECKDQKYRYWLTGFVFTPYQRDRYGNFVPVPGKDIPLEIIQEKLDKKDAAAYLDETGAFCKQFGGKLKTHMMTAAAQKKEKITKKVVADKW